MNDEQIIEVIDSTWRGATAADILVVLRDAGWEVVPADTAKLGRAVEAMDIGPTNRYTPPTWINCLEAIHELAGVDWP